MLISTHFPPPVMIESAASRLLVTHNVVLELGDMLLGRCVLRKRPGQHEFGLENRCAARHHPIQGRTHPPEQGMH